LGSGFGAVAKVGIGVEAGAGHVPLGNTLIPLLYPYHTLTMACTYYRGMVHANNGHVPLRSEPPIDAGLVEVMLARQQQYLERARGGME
jgi:hypothetical protein